MNEIIFYITVFCFAMNVIFGKLRLISIAWIYPLQRKKEQNEPGIPISVIICARNDLKELQNNLPFILEQEYLNFEVIVVNDASADETGIFLNDLSIQNSKLKIVDIPNKIEPGKKLALLKGIDKACNSFLLLTDADCKPSSKNWIQSHAKFASETNTVVLGYGKYNKQPGFLNMLIRYDTSVIAMRYMNNALWKHPYMGVGRNIGYSKDLSNRLNEINKSIASGDDDLFIQAVSAKADFMINLEKDSLTVSKPKQSINEWLKQKARHTTTAPYYSFITKLGIMIQWMISAGFYLGIIIILLTGSYLAGLILFSLNLLLLGLFNGFWFRKLGENDLILPGPFLDFIYTFVQPVFVIKSWGRKKDQWN